MTRRVVLIRHAKSSWANASQSDFDRPLNERGERDAPMMGKRLKDAGIIPDLVVASTAKRAAATAKHIAKEVGYSKDDIDWRVELYHCSPPVFEEVLYSIDDNVKTVFIVAHNPGISEFAASIAGRQNVDDMPTCAVVGVETDIKHWADFAMGNRQLFLFDYPKNEHE